MPSYDYQCGKCSREFTAFARVAERNAQSCPGCGAKCNCNAFSGSGFGIIGTSASTAWGKKGGRSLTFAFDPKKPEGWKKDLPSAEVDATGQVVFTSDKNQKQVYKEMRLAKERIEHAELAKAERSRRERGEFGHVPEHMAPTFAHSLAQQIGAPR